MNVGRSTWSVTAMISPVCPASPEPDLIWLNNDPEAGGSAIAQLPAPHDLSPLHKTPEFATTLPAWLGGMPMMMITGQKPIKKSKQGRFQILDVVSMMGPLTKYTHQLASADNIPSKIREAFRLAQEEKPGAVHIEFPEDIADEKTDEKPMPKSNARRPVADEKSIRAAAKRIEQARSPILVIGAGANRTMTSRMLSQFIEKTGIPFVST